jgi:hypothetical protein
MVEQVVMVAVVAVEAGLEVVAVTELDQVLAVHPTRVILDSPCLIVDLQQTSLEVHQVQAIHIINQVLHKVVQEVMMVDQVLLFLLHHQTMQWVRLCVFLGSAL